MTLLTAHIIHKITDDILQTSETSSKGHILWKYLECKVCLLEDK